VPTSAAASSERTEAASRAALFLVAAAAAIIVLGVYPLAGGLVAAPALAVICRPLHDRLRGRVGPNTAALIIVASVWIALVLPFVWLSVLASMQVPDALREVQSTVGRLRGTAMPVFGVSPDSLIAHVGSNSIGWLSGAVGPALGSIGHGILQLSIALLGLYFLLVGNDAAWRHVRRHLPFSPEGSEELHHVFVSVTRATLLGTLLSAALQGFSIGIGFLLIGNSAPAFWGIVGGFTTLVPVVGNALVWVPAVVVQLVERHFGAALVLLVFGKVIPSLLDRVVRAAISRRVGNTHPMVTLVGTLAGIRLVGAVGVLVGPTIVQCGLALVRLYEREYGLPWTNGRPSAE
jgi:predicted PurR-regulated permease PerM